MDLEMTVTKRSGKKETMMFDKIVDRLKNVGQRSNLKVNYSNLAMKVIDQLYDGIQTSQIDILSGEQCASMTTTHPDYGKLASYILISNHHKNTNPSFSENMKKLYEFRDVHEKHTPMINKTLFNISQTYAEELENMIDYERDYLFHYFGFKTLERAYLMRINGSIVERPQHMWMRVSVSIHGSNMEKVKSTYDNMSKLFFTHATPTLYNAGTNRQQLSSCYLEAMESDSIDGIYNTLSDCAKISKWAGGIGLHIHNVRASGSHIRGTNGTSNGIVPMLRVFNNTARYVDQCVTPDTWIYTTNGPKHIQDVICGETQIFNSEGNTEVIKNVLEHPYEGDMISIKTTHSLEPLQITENHPIYVIANQQKALNYKIIKNRLDKKLIDFEWKDAKTLNENDMLVYRIPTYNKDVSSISQDDCYFYGVLLGDGYMLNNSTSGHITLHTREKANVLSFAKTYFESKCIQYHISTENNTTRIRWNKTVNLPFRYSDIYDSNKEKQVAYRWLNLPIEKSKYILKGLLDTDGCNKKELVFDSTSRQMIESVRFILLKMGILSSGYIRDRRGEKHSTNRGIIENKKISYCLRIPKTNDICELMNIKESGNFYKFMKYNDFLFTRIKEINKVRNYSGTLYDLQMEKVHDYTIHNGIVHNGGGKRNGSFAIYLEPWHSDIEDFLQMRKNHGDEEMKARDLFYALWIPDLFMKRVKENKKWTLMCPDECPGLSDVYGDKFVELYERYESENKGRRTIDARELWFKMLDSQIETGTPYMLYKDAANKKSNQQNLGTIKSSNLCVAPETLILTDKGHIEIQTLKDKNVNVWNGKEFSEVTVKQTSSLSELIDVELSDGSKLTCTKYHKFYIQTKYPTFNMKQDVIKSNSVSVIEAKDLKPNMKLIKCDYPIIEGEKILKSSYTNGFFSGDGTYNKNNVEEKKCNYKSQKEKAYCKRHLNNQTSNEVSEYCNATCYTNKPIVSLYDEKIKLLPYLDYTSHGKENNNKLNVCLSTKNLKDKFFVPMNYSLQSKLDWFAGYSDADGTIAKNGSNQSLQISSIHKDFLIKIKLMLQTCGVSSKVTKNMDERKVELPDGYGNKKVYNCKKLWRLLVPSCELQTLVELGFEPKRLVINKTRVQRSSTHFIKISNIIDNKRTDKTFCFTEEKRHAGIFNGVITSQCTEIIEYSDKDQTAVCNLASIGLSKFVKTDKTFDYEHLHEITKIVTENLNKVIDINFYPIEKTRVSNLLHRPIGIGVQGLADAFALMDVPFESEEALEINKLIFETIYHGAVEKSMELSKERKEDMIYLEQNKKGWHQHKDFINEHAWSFDGFNSICQKYQTRNKELSQLLNRLKPTRSEYTLTKNYPNFAGSYSSIENSPISKGQLQFDLWGVTPSSKYDWQHLKEQIKENGVRNSLLLAPMPTASTSQILGNNECFEPFTSNIYIRRTNAGEFIIVNKYLMEELLEQGKWNAEIKNSIIANNGSIQHLDVSDHMKRKYKTAWEISMKHLINMSRDRGAFICQSQSLNLWVEEPVYGNLTAMHFYAWEQGLKTGLYYLRTRAKAKPQQFTIEPEKNQALVEEEPACEMCSA